MAGITVASGGPEGNLWTLWDPGTVGLRYDQPGTNLGSQGVCGGGAFIINPPTMSRQQGSKGLCLENQCLVNKTPCWTDPNVDGLSGSVPIPGRDLHQGKWTCFGM